MTDEPKRMPGGDPSRGDEVARRLQLALASPSHAGNVHIRLGISGGGPGERYELEFSTAGNGAASVAFSDELANRRHASEAMALSAETMRSMLPGLDAHALVALAQQRTPIPPCSLVGWLEVTHGQDAIRAPFMADREQARTAGFSLAPQIERLLEFIYDIIGKQLGVDNVRP